MGEAISLRVQNLQAARRQGRGTDWDVSPSWPHHAAALRRPRREASDPRERPSGQKAGAAWPRR